MTMTSRSDHIPTSNFEGIKTSMKQDKNGYVLTLSIHPDDVPEEIMRDFVGSRYQVVMVRLGDDDQPMDREKAMERDPVRFAGALCNNKDFARYIEEELQELVDPTPDEVADWLREKLGVGSRREMRTNERAAKHFWRIKEDFYLWTMIND